jgi:hypothetical protein
MEMVNMNRDWILSRLREAEEEMRQTIEKLESDPVYGEIDFEIAMADVYNHVNTAWNSRNIDPNQASRCSEKGFYVWRDCPSDIKLGR